MMPISMAIGVIFYNFFSQLAFITPHLIFLMLFFTYCKMNFDDIKLTPLHLWLIVIQTIGSVGIYLLIKPFGNSLAEGVMICVLAPTATAAAVITGMLKGNVASLTTYSLLSNITIAFFAPLLFSLIGNNTSLTFLESFIAISQKIMFLLILPFGIALLLQKFIPKTAKKIGEHAGISFYIWTFGLIIVTSRTVMFILQQNESSYLTEILIAIGALIMCILQFAAGRKIGANYNDTVAGGQGLGQKNNIFAIWMAQTYLHPIASIGPGSYVLWQNIINSWQIWRARKNVE